MAENLVIAKKERAVMRDSINKFINKIENLSKDENSAILDLEESLELLINTASDLKIKDSEIKTLTQEAQLDAELQTANEYREKIISWQFRGNRKIKELKKKDNCDNRPIATEAVSIKLPKLDLAKFTGNNSDWLNFWASFETAIHNNERLDPIDKLNYLKSFLAPEPLKCIQGFSVTAENYTRAIDILRERYGRSDLLINVHMNKLLNVVPLKYSGDVKSLRKIYDEIQINIRNLESLNVSLSSYGNLLTPILLKILPKDLVLEFNKDFHEINYGVQDLLSFLRKQLVSRENVITGNQDNYSSGASNFSQRNQKIDHQNRRDGYSPRVNKFDTPNHRLPTACDLLNENKSDKCNFCSSESHLSNKCFKTRNLPYEERVNLLRKKGLCYLCLTPSHLAKNCLSKTLCRLCNRRHSEIMCNKDNLKGETSNYERDEQSKQALSNHSLRANVYLQTLVVAIYDKDYNKSSFIRLIIDSGSHNSYVSKFAADRLKLKRINKETIKHGLFGGMEMSTEHNRYEFTIGSLDNKFKCKIQALDQEKICTGVNLCNDNRLVQLLEEKGVYLSDVPRNNRNCLYQDNPEEVHILLGADMSAKLFTDDIKYFPEFGLTTFRTKLGWTIMGKTEGQKRDQENSLAVLSLSLHVSNANLSDLWRLDTLGITDEENKSKQDLEQETQNHFLETVKRDRNGRYEVNLPWTIDRSILTDNYSLAEKCLYKTENKLTKSNRKKEYGEIFDFWESNQIIEEVFDQKKDGGHYLAHRPVIKESSETTKIRPVFNASAHTRNSPSLNDCLTKGPNLIEIIPSILNKFRKYKIGISSDIEKAFLQIKIAEKDRDFLRFFWFDRENKLKIYRHCRVVFGLTSSPFLLMATLNHLLNSVPEQWQETARLLKESFYLDNSLISLNSVQETENFISESQEILASAHFNLRCWRSNWPQAMVNEAENKPNFAPVLGLLWNLKNDSLICKTEESMKISEPLTKRKVLSITQRIFDPVGFTAPISLIPKLILQESWIQKIKWDEELPETLKQKFSNWLKDIHLLSKIEIPRWLNIFPENEKELSLHVFVDASRRAYATCIFLRTETSEGIKIQLVNAKSRVAPIKELTIPRLELLSCLIGARLAKNVKNDLNLADANTIFWSDSSTALSWIRRKQEWGTFVHNRVLEIRNLTDIQNWRHVPGNLNPSDLPSRGCSFDKLQKSRWWEGPDWLYLSENNWPQVEEEPNEEFIDVERKKTIITLLDKKEDDMSRFYHYFSSYKKNVRMIAWIFRFYHNSKNTEKTSESDISVEEFSKAENVLIRLVQQESFAGKNDPTLRNLRPIEDKVGLLRVKTNIIQRKDNENFKYPVILPAKHPVVQNLIYEKHMENHHAGVSILMAQMRENFWILKSRKCIRNVIRKCIICKKLQTSQTNVEPGIPPEDRVREAAIFEVVGVDLAGPLHLSDGSKAWITLFTCAVYRAIHLEAVTSLSTESFLQSLRRFIARRGRPHVVYSDNGKNFVGANKALVGVDWETISRAVSTQKIRWKFNPPAAPWWGGWWERLVRMVKGILRRKLGRASLNYEELCTILCDCEQVINSRPITYVSEDNSDPLPLTPMMFLQELPTSGVPDIDVLDSQDLNRRAKYRQTIREDLRNRFRTEYLGQLRQHASKTENFKRLKIGDIVLLEDFNKKRIHWPLAKVIEMYPGKDNVVRLAKVKTENGFFLRPLQRLYPLEIETAELKNYTSLDKSVREKLIPSISKSDDSLQKLGLNSKGKDSVKDPPEPTGVRTSKEKSSSEDPISRLPDQKVTRTGRVVKPPQRLQLGLLSSSK